VKWLLKCLQMVAPMGAAVVEQTHFNMYADGADNNTSTELGTEDTRFALTLDTTYFWRVKLKITGMSAGSDDVQLEYNVDGAGWNAVNTTSSNVRAVAGGDDDSDPTGTERLTNDGGTFNTGEYSEDGLNGAVTLAVGEIELAYAIQFRSADLSGGENIDLRVTNAGAAYNTYTEQDAASVSNDITLSPGIDTLILTGDIPTLATGVQVNAPNQLTLTGHIPSLRFDTFIAVPAGSLVLTGKAPSVEIIIEVAPSFDALIMTGRTPSVEITHIRGPPVGALVLTGKIPKRGVGLVLTGFAPSVNITQSIPVPKGSLTLAGKIPSVEKTLIPTPGTGALVLSGKIPSVEKTLIPSPPVGSLVLSGKIPSVEITHIRQPGTGSLILTGQLPDLGGDKTFIPPVGSLVLAGKIPTLDIHQPIETPGAGSLVLAGKIPTVSITVLRLPPVGSLVLAGKIPIVDVQQPIEPIPAGSLVLSGKVPTIVQTFNHFPAPGAGSLVLAGKIPTILADALKPDADNLIITTYAPSVQITHIRQPATGSLSITGQSVRFPEIPVGKGVLSLFGHAPIRPVGLRLKGHIPTLIVQPIGNITELPPQGSLALTGHVPTIIETGIVSDRKPAADNLILTGEHPAIVTDVALPPSSLLFTGHAPKVGFNIVQPGAGSLIITGELMNLITTIQFLPVGSLVLTGKVPTVITNIGSRTVSPPAGILQLTGHRPFRTTQQAGSGSAQVLITNENAASGTHLLKATITMPLLMDASKVGETLCFLQGTATITIPFKASGTGAFGNLKLVTATITISGKHDKAPSLYWYSDGTHVLGRATISI